MTITLHPVDAVDTDSDGVPDFPTYTGQHLRQVLSAIIGGSTASRPLGSFTGVSPGTPSNTVTASSTTWTIRPHAGVMDVETPVASGPYFYAVDANLTGSVTAANATNPRIDLLSLQLSDPAMADGSTVPGLSATYTTGTASATPSAPATPARAMVLAQITVPASGGGAPSVSWVAPYLSAAGGIVPCASSAAYPTSPYIGQYVDDAALGLLRWSGSLWTRAALTPDAYADYVNTQGPRVTADSNWHALAGWSGNSAIGWTYSGGVWTKATGAGSARSYEVFGKIAFPSDGTGQRAVRLLHNNTPVYEFSLASSAASNTHLPCRWWGSVSPGDTIEVDALISTAAGNQNLLTQVGMNLMTIKPSAG